MAELSKSAGIVMPLTQREIKSDWSPQVRCILRFWVFVSMGFENSKPLNHLFQMDVQKKRITQFQLYGDEQPQCGAIGSGSNWVFAIKHVFFDPGRN